MSLMKKTFKGKPYLLRVSIFLLSSVCFKIPCIKFEIAFAIIPIMGRFRLFFGVKWLTDFWLCYVSYLISVITFILKLVQTFMRLMAKLAIKKQQNMIKNSSSKCQVQSRIMLNDTIQIGVEGIKNSSIMLLK